MNEHAPRPWKTKGTNMNYPDGMTRSDLIAVGELDPPYEPEIRVLRAVVLLTYDSVSSDDAIEEVQTPYQAEKDIERALGSTARLTWGVTDIEVVDAEYLSLDEAGLAS